MFNKRLGISLIFWGVANTWCPSNEVSAKEVGSALFTAINLGLEGDFDQKEKALKLLDQAIEEELNLNVRNEEGITLLNYALLAHDTDVALAILQRANIDIDAANVGEKQCWAPLHIAVGAGNLGCQEDFIIDEILDKNPEINIRDARKATPLHYAAGHANGSAVQKLIDRGALINAVDENWNTPLHWAAFCVNITSAEALLYNYADINSRNGNRRTPLHLAAQVGSAEMVNLLLSYGADINAADLNDNTPLHDAVLHNHADAMELLYACGADTLLKNWAGYEPFELLVGSETREEYDAKEKKERIPVPVSSDREKSNAPQAKELPNGKTTASSESADEKLPNGKRSNSPQVAEELPSKKAKVE